jgi:hypothetical protein
VSVLTGDRSHARGRYRHRPEPGELSTRCALNRDRPHARDAGARTGSRRRPRHAGHAVRRRRAGSPVPRRHVRYGALHLLHVQRARRRSSDPGDEACAQERRTADPGRPRSQQRRSYLLDPAIDGTRAVPRRARAYPPPDHARAGRRFSWSRRTIDREPESSSGWWPGSHSFDVCGGVQVTSRRRPSSAASRATRSRLRSAHRPETRSSRRLRTARCSASGPTLAHTDTPRRT